jgi:crossover junction endodeoxyribonuclease RusA
MRIEVAGIPAPQGSKRHVGGGRMVEMSRAVGPWREAVRAETQRALAALPNNGCASGLGSFAHGPKRVDICFYLPRPKSAPRSVEFPVKRPDLDKLVRAVLDGMTAGGAWPDDSEVIEITAQKVFASSRGPGCIIYVNPVKEDE